MFGAKHFANLSLGENVPHPGHSFFIPEFQHPKNGVLRISLGAKSVQVCIPE